MAGDSIHMAITVKVGDCVMKVSDQRPLFLSGDRRRWRKQIADYVAEQAELVGQRFAPETLGGAPLRKGA